MTNTEEYNGYPNYQTWAVNLWLTSVDQGSYSQVQEMTQEARDVIALADSLEEMVTEDNPYSEKSNLYTDLLTSAINRVDWHHLARNYWDTFRGE